MQPTPLFLPRESCGQRSLVGCCPLGRRVRHNWSNSACMHALERKWHPTPVFLPGESQRQRNLVGCRLSGRRVRHDWSNLAAAEAENITFYNMWNNMSNLKLFMNFKYIIIEGFRNKVKEKSQRKILPHFCSPLMQNDTLTQPIYKN